MKVKKANALLLQKKKRLPRDLLCREDFPRFLLEQTKISDKRGAEA